MTIRRQADFQVHVPKQTAFGADQEGPPAMDATDRRLLALLREDATLKYADLAERLHLSAPALHERVKKLRARGVIRRTTVDLDPKALGHGLCAFVHVETEGWSSDMVSEALARDGRVEEVHSVAGDTCLILKVRAASPEDLEMLLRAIFDLKGVRRTESYVVLRTYIERGPDPLAGETANGAPLLAGGTPRALPGGRA